MGSDSSEAFGQATVIGNNFSISINADSEEEAGARADEEAGEEAGEEGWAEEAEEARENISRHRRATPRCHDCSTSPGGAPMAGADQSNR